jgi:antitoxin ParD1/3/4
MATMNIVLPDLLRAWVDAQVESGHFVDASDYVRELIRRDEDYQAQRAVLTRALLDGEESGESTRLIGDVWESVRTRHPRAV